MCCSLHGYTPNDNGNWNFFAIVQSWLHGEKVGKKSSKSSVDIPCDRHHEYHADCDACNALTRKAAQQQAAESRATQLNKTIPCERHHEYRADCDACNALTCKAAQQDERKYY